MPERQVDRLPAILSTTSSPGTRQRERKARLAWETFFAPEFIFNRNIDQILPISEPRRIPQRLYRSVRTLPLPV